MKAEKVAGELAAGTVTTSEEKKCGTCGIVGPTTIGGHCLDVAACTTRRIARSRPEKILTQPPPKKFLIELSYYGRTYYVQTFTSKPTDPTFVGKLNTLFQAILERGEATKFSDEDAQKYARAFGGKIVPL